MIFRIAQDVSGVYKMAMRLITSGIGLVVFFAALFADELVFSFALMIVTAGMVYEVVKAVKPGKTVTAASIILSVLAFFAMMYFKMAALDAGVIMPALSAFYELCSSQIWNVVLIAAVTSVFIYLLLSVILFDKADFHKIYSSFFLTAYITLFMACIMFLRVEFGRYAVVPVFLFSWITDSGAYFAGRFAGKHKLAPNLSPKKTVEGAVGGVIAAVIGTIIYLLVLKYGFNMDGKMKTAVIFIIAAVIGSVLSEIGDLTASVVKRRCGIKDFGRIFPGHGGFMDRFDSVVFIAPYVYFIFVFMSYLS